jgi:acyl-CoA reductase-like NAD-dependent aldehyde dehydrogenase
MKMLIDSQWVDASDGKWREVRNPGTGEVIDKVPQATLDDAKGALEAAQHAKEAMRRMPCVPALRTALSDRPSDGGRQGVAEQPAGA